MVLSDPMEYLPLFNGGSVLYHSSTVLWNGKLYKVLSMFVFELTGCMRSMKTKLKAGQLTDTWLHNLESLAYRYRMHTDRFIERDQISD